MQYSVIELIIYCCPIQLTAFNQLYRFYIHWVVDQRSIHDLGIFGATISIYLPSRLIGKTDRWRSLIEHDKKRQEERRCHTAYAGCALQRSSTYTCDREKLAGAIFIVLSRLTFSDLTGIERAAQNLVELVGCYTNDHVRDEGVAGVDP